MTFDKFSVVAMPSIKQVLKSQCQEGGGAHLGILCIGVHEMQGVDIELVLDDVGHGVVPTALQVVLLNEPAEKGHGGGCILAVLLQQR